MNLNSFLIKDTLILTDNEEDIKKATYQQVSLIITIT